MSWLNKIQKFLKFWNTPRFIIIYIVIALFLLSSLISFLSARNFARHINEFNKNLSEVSSSLAKANEEFNIKIAKISRAELLMNNTNRILSTIYYGTAATKEKEKNFTGFSIIYKDKYYVITAGHCVEMNGEKFENIKFKANNKNFFISPKLIDYKNDYNNNIDYAIFYNSNIITTGLYPASFDEDQTPQYVLGNIEKNLNLVRRYDKAKEGESGSPILNSNCHVVGIMIKKSGAYTPISVVIEALDKIEKDL